KLIPRLRLPRPTATNELSITELRHHHTESTLFTPPTAAANRFEAKACRIEWKVTPSIFASEAAVSRPPAGDIAVSERLPVPSCEDRILVLWAQAIPPPHGRDGSGSFLPAGKALPLEAQRLERVR
ncbi:MAG: hypothetical protein ACM3QU_11245, partial [Verrucomicrobiota bacterium]